MTTKKTALITGASAGIGEAFARRLAADGWDLVLVARSQAPLAALAEELGATGIDAQWLAADLTTDEGVAAVVDRLATDTSIDLLVNNAGAGRYGRFDAVDPSVVRSTIALNVVAAAEIAQAALAGMVVRDRGAVINVSSLISFTSAMPPTPLPLRATYAASKAFVLSLTRLIAGELAGTKVQIQALCPGIVRTGFHVAAGVDPNAPTRFTPMEPDEIVAASLRGLELGETVCIPGLPDPDLILGIDEAEKALFLAAGPGPLAERYRNA